MLDHHTRQDTSLQFIHVNAFHTCTSLQFIHVNAIHTGTSLQFIHDNAIHTCTSLQFIRHMYEASSMKHLDQWGTITSLRRRKLICMMWSQGEYKYQNKNKLTPTLTTKQCTNLYIMLMDQLYVLVNYDLAHKQIYWVQH